MERCLYATLDKLIIGYIIHILQEAIFTCYLNVLHTNCTFTHYTLDTMCNQLSICQ